MTKARKQANFRGKIAGLFFIFLLVNIAMKIAGISTVDQSQALRVSHVTGMIISYYAIPVFFLLSGLVFMELSRRKSAEAESIEISGCSW